MPAESITYQSFFRRTLCNRVTKLKRLTIFLGNQQTYSALMNAVCHALPAGRSSSRFKNAPEGSHFSGEAVANC